MIWRSTTFRFAALVFTLQVIAMAVLLVGLGAILRERANRDAVATAETIRDDLLATHALGGDGALAHAIRLRTARPVADDAVLLFADAQGKPIAGNLADWPAGLADITDYDLIELRRSGSSEREAVLARATRLAGGQRLLSGVAVQSQRQLLGQLEHVSLLALALGFVFAALAAWLAARLIVNRLGTTIATLDAVQGGDLARRVPEDRSGDAFATLGADVNRTLDRVAGLIGELQIATDGLAHDLKSPLTRMRAALERALAQVEEPAAQEAVERALAESDRLMAIVQTALNISRAEAGIGRDSFVAADLGEMLETIAEIYAPLAEDRGRGVAVTAAPGIVRPVNRQLLGQAIGNLIDNAIHYGAGDIDLTLHQDAAGVALAVRDRGAGIAVEQRGQALRRFGRLDAARAGPGAGLGLTLVQAVAHLHGGAIELGDAQPGLIVTIRLP